MLIDLPEGDPCPQGGNYQVTLDLLCDPNNQFTGKLLNREEFDPDSCHNTMKIVTDFACPVNQHMEWYNSLYVNKSQIAMLMVVIGFFYVFLGNQFEFITVTSLLSISFSMIVSKSSSGLIPISGNYKF
jgi:hypothetical protein